MVAARKTLAMVICVLPGLVCAGGPAEDCDADGHDTLVKPLAQSVLQRMAGLHAQSLGVTEDTGKAQSVDVALPCGGDWWMWRRGDGTGGPDVRLRDGVNKAVCQTLCEEKRKEDKDFNGCTWSPSLQSCWAEKRMTGAKFHRDDWQTTWLPCPRKVIPSMCNKDSTWNWVDGAAANAGYHEVDRNIGLESCQDACLRFKKERDSSGKALYNGCCWSSANGWCWAARRMAGSDGKPTDKGFKSSFLPYLGQACEKLYIKSTNGLSFTTDYSRGGLFGLGEITDASDVVGKAYGRYLCKGQRNLYPVSLKHGGSTFSGYIYFTGETNRRFWSMYTGRCESADSPICANMEAGDYFLFAGDGPAC